MAAGIDVGALVLQMSADLKHFESELKKAQGMTNKAMRAMEKRVREADKRIDNHFKNMGRRAAAAFGAIGAALGMRELANMADQWSDLNARLTLATGSVHAGADAMERLGQVANRSYSSLETTVEAFISNSTALKELGYNTQQQLDYTEALNNALVISGAKGDRAKAVMNALSKAMAGGKLSGQNLNTVIEQGGRVAEALAESMGVSVNQLRQLGAEGKITTKEMFGITSQLGKLGKELDRMDSTIGDGFTLIKNALLNYVGSADQATAISGTLAKGLEIIARNFNVLGDTALMVASLIASSLIGRSIAPLIKKALDAGVAISALIKAMRQAQTLSAGIGAVMSAGTILGGIAGLAAGGIALAYLHYANNAAKAEAASARLSEEFVKVGLIAREAEEAVDSLADSYDKFSEAGRLRKLQELREEMERMTKIGGLFGIGDGKIEDVIDGLKGYADAFGDVNAKTADYALKLAGTVQIVPSAAKHTKGMLEELLKVEGVSREVAEFIVNLIKLCDQIIATETYAQSLGKSLYLEEAQKSAKDIGEALRMAVHGMGVEIEAEIYKITKQFEAGEKSAEELKAALKSMPELAGIFQNLRFDIFSALDALTDLTKAMGENAERAEELKKARLTAMEEITQEWLTQQKLFENYAKGQEEINALTREELELRRAISQEKSDFEKEAGAGKAKFIPEGEFENLAKARLEADKRRSKEGKSGRGRRDNDFERITKQLQERTEALRNETAIQSTLNPFINDYGFALTKARIEQELLNAAIKSGVAEKEGVKQAIAEVAEAYAFAKVEGEKLNETQDRLRQKLQDVQQTAKDVMSGFINDLIAGKSATEALGNAISKIGNKLLDSGLNALFDGLFQGFGGGGGGGLFGGLFRADGGEVRRYPNGHITGKGTSRSDSIPTMLSNGEFVVNAAATKKHRALLEQINAQGLQFRADGGLVGKISMPSLPSARELQGLKDKRERALRVDVTPSPFFDVKVSEITQNGIERATPLIINQAVKQSDSRVVRNVQEAKIRGMM